MNFVPPMVFNWNGEAMVPLQPKRADRFFVIGENYRLGIIEERSSNSHSHYFAAVNEAWKNLPEEEAERFPTADHLRKYALIRAGYYDERSVTCASEAEAQRVAAFIQPMDDFAIVDWNGAVVRVFTAKSQSYRAMDKKDFADSKQKVLEIVAQMIGTKVEELSANTNRAA